MGEVYSQVHDGAKIGKEEDKGATNKGRGGWGAAPSVKAIPWEPEERGSKLNHEELL